MAPKKFRHSVAPSSMLVRLSGVQGEGSISDMFAHKRKLAVHDSSHFPSPKRPSLSPAQSLAGETGQSGSSDECARLRQENSQLIKQVEFMENELDKMEAVYTEQTKHKGVTVECGVMTDVCTGVTEEHLRQERSSLYKEAMAMVQRAQSEMGPKDREIAELLSTVKRLEERERQTMIRLDHATSSAASLTSLKMQMEKEKKEMSTKEKEWRSEVGQLKVQVSQLQRTNDILQRQADKNPATKELKTKIQTLQSSEASAVQQLEEARSAVKQLKIDIQDRDKQVQDLKTKMADQPPVPSDELVQLSEEKNRICEQLVEMSFQHEEDKSKWLETHQSHLDKVNSLEKQGETFKMTVEKLQKEVESKTTALQETQAQLTQATSHSHAQQSRQFDSMEKTIESLTQTSKRHETDLKTVRDEKDTISVQLAQAKQQVEEAAKGAEDTKELKIKMAGLENECSQLRLLQSDAKSKVEALREELEKAKQESAAASSGSEAMSELKKQLDQQVAANAKLHQYAVMVADDNDRLRQQHSTHKDTHGTHGAIDKVQPEPIKPLKRKGLGLGGVRGLQSENLAN